MVANIKPEFRRAKVQVRSRPVGNEKLVHIVCVNTGEIVSTIYPNGQAVHHK